MNDIPIYDPNNKEEKNNIIYTWCLEQHNKSNDFIEGFRHKYMLKLAFYCNDYGIDKDFVEGQFLSMFIGEGVYEREIKDIVDYCYKSSDKHGSKTFYIKRRNTNSKNEKNELKDTFLIDCFLKEERGDAELLHVLFQDSWLYDHTANKWIKYKKGVWAKDETKQVRKKAIIALTDAYKKLIANNKELIGNLNQEENSIAVISEEIKRTESWIKKLESRCKNLNKLSRINSVLEITTSYLPILTEQFDSNPKLLNLENGVYDFEPGTLIKHSPTYYFYHQMSIMYNRERTCPNWLAFLFKVFDGDGEMISFIQKCIGYSLTGLNDFQSVIFCYGSGANGKSIFFSVLKMLLGDYYTTIPISTLLIKKNDNTTEYQLAKLKGVRVAVASEIPEGKKLNESQVKDLTGGERVCGRFPHEKPFEFDSTHKLWMFGNHKPIVNGTDIGIWRRIKLVPFDVTIPKEERREMSEMLKEFKEELPGIFNWAVEGYKSVRKDGWKIPKKVEEATEEYKEESDTLNEFLLECTTKDAASHCQLQKLFVKYLEWCKQNSDVPMYLKPKNLSQQLRNKGYKVEKGGQNKTVVKGISIIESGELFSKD